MMTLMVFINTTLKFKLPGCILIAYSVSTEIVQFHFYSLHCMCSFPCVFLL